MNTISITGNLTRDPELKFTVGGNAVCNFAIASSQGKDKDVMFIDVTAWKEPAENVAELKKGDRVVISGILKQEWWETDGQMHNKFKITAQEVGASLRWAKVNIIKKEKGKDD